MRDDQLVSIPSAFDNSVRIGYARVSTRTQDHQAQLDALAAARCREVVVETASTRDARPKLRATLAALHAGDTLVIYKPDRVARSMKELLVLLEDQLHARGINLHILTGICAGLHRPDGTAIADKMLFMIAAMAAEMERDLIRERTLDGLRAARDQGRRGGRPAAVSDDILAIARAYLVVRGMPVRNYRGEVALTPAGDGTRIRWTADWDNTMLGRMAWRGLRTFFPEMMTGLVAAAERDAVQSP